MIPEHVKRKAMDAVAAYESTSFICVHAEAAAPARIVATPTDAAPFRRSLSAEQIKMAAMDAVAHRETVRQMRHVPHDGRVYPMSTPSTATTRAADRIAQLHQSGLTVDAVHGWATKDHFGKDHA